MPSPQTPRRLLSPLLGVVLCLAPVAPAEATVYVFKDKHGVVHFSDVRHHEGYRPYRLVSQGSRSRLEPVVPASAARVLSVRAWEGVIAWAGRSHGLEPSLVKAVIKAESNFDPWARSHKGAQGLMQLMPATARELGVDDPFDPWQNIEGGTRYLSSLIQRFQGDISLGLAAYHAGEAAVRRYSGIPPYRETRRYVKRVLDLYRRYGAESR